MEIIAKTLIQPIVFRRCLPKEGTNMSRNASQSLLTLAALVALVTFPAVSADAARYHLRYRTERFYERNLSNPPTHSERGPQYYNHWNQPAKVTPSAPVIVPTAAVVPVVPAVPPAPQR